MDDCADASRKNKDHDEFQTQILPAGDGFVYLPPADNGKFGGKIFVLPGTVATVHSHGKDQVGVDDEVYTEADKDTSDKNKIPGFLITPGKKRKRYDPDPDRKHGGPITQWDPKEKKWKSVKK